MTTDQNAREAAARVLRKNFPALGWVTSLADEIVDAYLAAAVPQDVAGLVERVRGKFGNRVAFGSDADGVNALCDALLALSAKGARETASNMQEVHNAPAGWKLVPVEPTPEMVEAGWPQAFSPSGPQNVNAVYRAMLAAAPSPATTVQAGVEDSPWLGPYRNAAEALDSLRRAVAEQIGADPDTWPDHHNAPLAIAAALALAQSEPAPGEWEAALEAAAADLTRYRKWLAEQQHEAERTSFERGVLAAIDEAIVHIRSLPRPLDADVQDEIRIAWHTIIARALQSERDRSASTITALREDVERLRHEVDSAGALRLRMEAHKQSAQAAEAPLTALRERAETAEREVERLREALAPFAHRADACNKVDRTYSTEDWTPELLNDFRRARAALEASDA